MGGGAAAILNLLLIYFLIEYVGLDNFVLRNLANLFAIELSLVASFFIYRIWVWPGGSWKLNSLLLRQLPLYHLSAGFAVILRIFLIFPLLDWLGISYAVNTFIGIATSASLNYIMSDRLVFKESAVNNPLQKCHSGLYPPEGLAPGLEKAKASIHQGYSRVETGRKIELLSLVIPAYNEEGCIVETVQSIAKNLEQESIDYELLVINDNSRDNTEFLLQKLSYENPRVRYLNSYFPNGFGFAIRCGLENFKGDAVAIVMADSSDSPDDIVAYYRQLQQGYDCVFGSRFVRGGRVIDYPAHKLFVNRLANLFVRVIFGLNYNDTTNAFKLYRREVIEGISPLISHHFNLTVEMPLKSIVRGYSYAIIPITWRNRKTGISKLKIKEMGSRYLFIVLYIWLEKYLSRGDYHRSTLQRKVATHV